MWGAAQGFFQNSIGFGEVLERGSFALEGAGGAASFALQGRGDVSGARIHDGWWAQD